MHVELDEVHMCTKLVEHGFSGFGYFVPFHYLSNFPFGPWTIYSPWLSKNFIEQNRLKKFMHVGIDVMYMHTNFGGHGLSSFGDIATFKNGQISLSDHGL